MVVKNNYGGKTGAYKSCSGRPDDHTEQRGMVHGLPSVMVRLIWYSMTLQKN
jgi:hypothetical protein